MRGKIGARVFFRQPSRPPPRRSVVPARVHAYVSGSHRVGKGRVAQLVRALLSHSRGPGFESLRAHSMKISLSHLAASLLLVAAFATAGAAQQLPTTQQAQVMLQTPDMVTRLPQQLPTSGLTPDQVRARLTAEGY